MKTHKFKPVIENAKHETECDECGEEFVITPRDILHREYPDGIHIDYFKCPFCAERYVTTVTDKELRRLIKLNSKRSLSGKASPDMVMKARLAALKEQYSERVKS